MTLRGLLIALICLFTLMALAVFVLDGCSNACDNGSTSGQDHSQAGDTAGTGDKAGSTSSGIGTSQSQTSMMSHDGNTPKDNEFVDCSNPFWKITQFCPEIGR